jgi:predicted ATPase
MKNILSLLFILYLVISVHAQQPAWYQKLKQVKPFISSKADVERIFGDAGVYKSFIGEGVEFVYYEATGEGKLSVVYSSGKCDEVSDAPFDIEKGKVLSAMFFPADKFVSLSKFKVNKKELNQERGTHTPHLNYVSDELGIEFTTQRNTVAHVHLFPALRYASLKCKNSEPFRNFREDY